MKRNRKQSSAAKPGKVWQQTQYSNLLRYVPSETYFARIRVGGKLIRRSLETTVLNVAKRKLADLEKEDRTRLENHKQFGSAKATFDDLLAEYRTRLEANHSIKPRTRAYYNERIEAMLQSWSELRHFDARKLKPEDCEPWAAEYVKESRPMNFDHTIGILRAILQIGVEWGIRYSNPAAGLKRARLRKREFKLPSPNEFHAFVQEIRSVPVGPGLASADLVEFLAYGGFRKNEAAHVTWADCDFDKGEIVVRGSPGNQKQ